MRKKFKIYNLCRDITTWGRNPERMRDFIKSAHVISGITQKDKANHQTDAAVKKSEDDQAQSMRVYPKVSGLAAWSENCKWYSSLPLCAVVSLFCELVE
jgi:hypothetical protein